jgi:hypothetical protein
MLKSVIKLLIFFMILTVSSASKILFLYPCPSKSHMVIVHALSTTLAERGHEVTVVSPYPLDNELKNHREIRSLVTSNAIEVTSKMIKKSDNLSFDVIREAVFVRIEMGVKTAESEEFKKLLDEKFDLLIVGMMFQNFLLGFGDHFKCPTIMLSVQRHMTLSSEIVGNPFEPHSIPVIGMEKGSGFLWRLENFYRVGKDYLMTRYFDYQQKIAYE